MDLNYDTLDSGADLSTWFANERKTKTERIISDTRSAAIGVIPGAMAGAIDTIGQSVGLFDEDTMANSINAIFGNTAATVYNDHKTGYRAIGDVATMFAGAGLATKALRSSSLFIKTLESAGKYGKNLARVIAIDEAGQSAALAAYEAKALSYGEMGLRNLEGTTSLIKARNNIKKTAFLNGLKSGIAGEVFIRTLQSDSDLFFPEGQGVKEGLISAGLIVGLPAAMNRIVLNPVLKKIARNAGQRAAKLGVKKTAVYGANLAGSVKAEEIFNNLLHSGEITDSIASEVRAAKDTAAAHAKDAIMKLASVQGEAGISKSFAINHEQIARVKDIAKKSPNLATNIISIDDINIFDAFTKKGKSEIENAIKDKIDALKVKLEEASSTSEIEHYNRLLIKAKKKYKDTFFNTFAVRVDALGLITSGSERYRIVTDIDHQVKFGADSFLVVPQKSGVKKPNLVGISIDGQIIFGGQKRTSALGLTPFEVTKVYRTMDKSAEYLLEHGLEAPNKIGIKTNYVKLDYLIHVLDKAGGNWNKLTTLFNLPVEYSNKADLEWAALRDKFKAFLKITDRKNVPAIVDLSNMLNLQLHNQDGSVSALGKYFYDLKASKLVVDDLSLIADSKDEFLAKFHQHTMLGLTKDEIEQAIKIGHQHLEKYLNYDMANKLAGKPMKTFSLIVKRPEGGLDDPLSIHRIAQIGADEHMQRVSDVTNYIKKGNNEPIKHVLRQIENLTHLEDAIRKGAEELMVGASTTPVAKKLGKFLPTTVTHDLRGVKGAEAVQAYSDVWQRALRQSLADDMKTGLVNVAKLRHAENIADRQALLNYYSTYNHGWELAEDVPSANGTFKLVEESEINKELAEKFGLDEVPEYLPDPVEPTMSLKLTGLALDAWSEIKRYDAMDFQTTNDILIGLGKQPIPYRKGHVVVPSRYGKEVAYIANRQGRVVAYTTGATEEAAKQEAYRQAKKLGVGHTVVSRSDVKRYKLLNDQAWSDRTINVADAWSITGGKAAKGKAGIITDPKFLDEIVDTISSRFEDTARRVIQTKFADMLDTIKLHQDIAAVSKEGFRGQKAFDDIFDQYTRQLLNDKRPVRGSFYGSINELADTFVSNSLTEVTDLLRTDGKVKLNSDAAKTIAAKLTVNHDFNPNLYAEKLLEKQAVVDRGWSGFRIMRKTSAITQFIMLKMLELGHSLLTGLSIGTTFPHNIRWMQRLKGESYADYSARVGYFADLLEQQDVVLPNPSKHMYHVFGKWLRGEYKDIIEAAVKAGYADAPIGEALNHLGAVPGKTSKAKEWAEKLLTLGGITEKTEKWTRVMAILHGYELAKQAGRIADDGVALAFGNDFANKVIADYRPSVKPEVFKGILGMPLGLFQTFSINYYQKLFHGLENKAAKTLATQFGTQAAMFGFEGLPGYDLFNQYLFANYDQSRDISETIRGNSSPGMAALLLYGTAANIPKLFGADDGLAINTRGAMFSPRNTSILKLEDSPFYSIVSKTIKTISGAVGVLTQEGPIDSKRYLQEALINASVNRPLRGMLEIAQGYSTNSYGDLINDNTRSFMSIVARSIGLKTQREAALASITYKERQGRLARQAYARKLGLSVIGTIREDGSLDRDRLMEVHEEYIANGGTEKGFRIWYKNLLKKATISRPERDVDKLMKHDPTGKSLLRYYGLGTSLDQSGLDVY